MHVCKRARVFLLSKYLFYELNENIWAGPHHKGLLGG